MWLWRAVFAVAVAAFLILSVVRTIVIKSQIIGLELPHPLPLLVAVLGGRRIRQRCRASPLNIRVFVCIIVLVFIP